MTKKLNPPPKLSNARDRDAWERTDLLWSGVFLTAVLLSLFLALQDETITGRARQTAVALSIVLVLWHVGFTAVYRWRAPLRQSTPLGLIYSLGILSLWFLTVRIDAAFYFTLFGLISQFYLTLPLTWAAGMTIMALSVLLYGQTLGEGRPINWQISLVYLLMAAAGIMLGAWIHSIIRQSVERRTLIEKLEATQAELAEAERKAGVLAERQRLAHEIHDTLAQGFISVVMHLEAAEQALGDSNATAQRHVLQARQTAREGLGQARRLVQDLRPEPLEDAALPEAIQSVAGRWADASGIGTAVTVTGQVQPLPGNVETTLLRVTQEALANVRKHAQARSVAITLSYLGDVVLLDVQDDGVGLAGGTAVADPQDGGFGLIAMRERVTQLGGELLIESEPGEGTTVAVSIPINNQQQGAASEGRRMGDA